MKKSIKIFFILLLSFFMFIFSDHVNIHADGFDDINYEEVDIGSQ